MGDFSFERAFSRNLGWVTPSELQTLRHSKVAIAGMGGVGGIHLITLVRLGVGRFHIADFDQFEVENFNRQYGAAMSTVGTQKAETMMKMAKDINPEVEITIFSDGVNRQNMDAFLDGVDLYVDGLDIFAMQVRDDVFAACEHKGIPATTSGPIATGSAQLTFMPGKMSFHEYFAIRGLPTNLQVLKFLTGLTPSFMQARYLVDRKYFVPEERKTPSTPMGCQIAAGLAATEALKILLKRGRVFAAPWSLHFDPYLAKYKRKYVFFGAKNPWQRLKFAIASRLYTKRPAPSA